METWPDITEDDFEMCVENNQKKEEDKENTDILERKHVEQMNKDMIFIKEMMNIIGSISQKSWDDYRRYYRFYFEAYKLSSFDSFWLTIRPDDIDIDVTIKGIKKHIRVPYDIQSVQRVLAKFYKGQFPECDTKEDCFYI